MPVETDPIRQGVLRNLRRRLLRSSSDFETIVGCDSVLVIAPHPDDESIGCGGLIAMARRMNVDVQIAFVTCGEASHSSAPAGHDKLKDIRRTEAREAAGRLGVPQEALHFLEIPDGQVREHREEIIAAVLQLFLTHKPKTVCLPHAKEAPPDHHLTTAYSRIALGKWAQPVRILEYGVWYWEHWPWVPLEFNPRANSRSKWLKSALRGFGAGAFSEYNCRLDISEVLSIKERAMEAHASQFGGADFPKDWPTLRDLENGLIVQAWLQPVESFRMTRLSP